MTTLRNGAPKKNMFGSIQRCDAVIDYQPCPNRATTTLVPWLTQTFSYWCKSHAPEVN